MSSSKYIDKICAVVLLLSLILTILFINGEVLGLQKLVDEDAEAYSGSVWFTANDQNGSWDTSGATIITLTGDGGKISGSGAYAYDGNIVISNGGYYVVSGTLEDGSIIVDAYSSSKVWILLSGVAITCSDDACIRVEQADKVFLTLAESSENHLSSGADYSASALSGGTDGAIFSHDDLTINGAGALTVSADYKHGIAANDDLVITGGTITVSAPGDAIHANDSLRVKQANLSLTAGDDGVVVSKEGGYLYVESGALDIVSADDGIHTAGDVTIAAGRFTIAAGDDGIHSDTAVSILGGTLLISECYEGIEAPAIDISGGDIEIYPSDDGLNANGGSSDFGGPMGGFGGGMPGMGSFDAAGDGSGPEQAGENGSASETAGDSGDTMPYIHISGGALTIVNETARDADGLDSNGDIYITGGTVRVSLVNSGSNSAIDYGSESGGVCEISGGTVIACGSQSMAEGFDSTSTQCSILYNYSSGAEAGTVAALKDSEGSTLLSWEVPCSFSSMVMSSPELELGEDYLVVIGDNVEQITLDEVSASFGDAQSAMFGGGMNWGGMQSRQDFMDMRGGRGGMGGGRPGQNAGDDSSAGEEGDAPFDGSFPPDGDLSTGNEGEAGGFPASEDGAFQPPEPPDGSSIPSEDGSFQPPEPPSGGSMTPEDNSVQSTEEGGNSHRPGDSGEVRSPGGGWDQQNPNAPADQEASGEASSDTEDNGIALGTDVKLLLGASAVVLLAGLAIAKRYRRF